MSERAFYASFYAAGAGLLARGVLLSYYHPFIGSWGIGGGGVGIGIVTFFGQAKEHCKSRRLQHSFLLSLSDEQKETVLALCLRTQAKDWNGGGSNEEEKRLIVQLTRVRYFRLDTRLRESLVGIPWLFSYSPNKSVRGLIKTLQAEQAVIEARMAEAKKAVPRSRPSTLAQ